MQLEPVAIIGKLLVFVPYVLLLSVIVLKAADAATPASAALRCASISGTSKIARVSPLRTKSPSLTLNSTIRPGSLDRNDIQKLRFDLE